ncbi:MAG: TadE/TadG family type IV pilus assembly protein [Mycobacteriales bacterium]
MTRARDEDGAAVVDFVLVSVLVLALFLVVLQVGVVLHTRTVLVASAAEGARYGADADRTPDEAAQRAHDAVADALSPAVADRLTFRGRQVDVDGAPVVEVTVSGPVPVVFLPAGPLTLTVKGHALEESRP